MRTIISSIPLIKIPNEKGYSIDDVETMLKKDFQIYRSNFDTLKVSISGKKVFNLRIGENIIFYKNSPIFFKIYFVLTFIPFALSLIALIFYSLFGLSFSNLNFWGILLVLFILVFTLLLYQIPEIIYFSLMSNRHVKYIDRFLSKIEMNR